MTDSPWLPEAAVEALAENDHAATVCSQSVLDWKRCENREYHEETANDTLNYILPFIQAGVREWLLEKAERHKARCRRAWGNQGYEESDIAATLALECEEIVGSLCPVPGMRQG